MLVKNIAQFDFIIIGSGLAGLCSALHAAEKGSVLLVTKGSLPDSNSWYAQGGVAAALDPRDHFSTHIEDTLKAGHRTNNKKTVEFIVQRAPAAIRWLKKMGVPFEHLGGSRKFDLRLEGGHSFPRIIHVGDHTGRSVVEVLLTRVRASKKIKIQEKTFVTDLLVHKGECYGVRVAHLAEPILGRRVILATGGLGQLYAHTTNPEVATGDGIALAYRAGAKIKDLDNIQFHPTAFADEIGWRHFLLSETLRGAGAVLLNSKGKRFMPRYHADAELAPRDVVSRAIFEQQKKGSVYLSFKNSGLSSREVAQKFPTIFKFLKKHGYDLAHDSIPVTPAAHYSGGGVATDLQGRTNVKNLYAVGEVANTGFHGANRLASNSLLECVVMGAQASKVKLLQAPSSKFQIPNVNSNIQVSNDQKKSDLAKIRRELQTIMWKNVGIVRTKTSLKRALKKIQELPKTLHGETNNMITTSLLIIQSALKH